MSEIKTAFNRSLIIVFLAVIGGYAMYQGDDFTIGAVVGCFCGLLRGSE